MLNESELLKDDLAPPSLVVTCLLTAWSRVLPDKLTGSQIGNIPNFVQPHSEEPATCPCPEPDWSNKCPNLTSRRWILILLFHLQLRVSSGLLSSGLTTRDLYASLPHTCYMPYPSQSSWLDHPSDIWWGVQSIKLVVMQSSPLPCYLVPVRLKYSLQHPILENPKPKFLLQYEEPIFTPIKNRQNYSSVYLIFYIFGQKTGRQKILHRMTPSISQIQSGSYGKRNTKSVLPPSNWRSLVRYKYLRSSLRRSGTFLRWTVTYSTLHSVISQTRTFFTALPWELQILQSYGIRKSCNKTCIIVYVLLSCDTTLFRKNLTTFRDCLSFQSSGMVNQEWCL